jgi:lysophospholipase L1-like esterase
MADPILRSFADGYRLHDGGQLNDMVQSLKLARNVSPGPTFAIFGTSITDQCSRNIPTDQANPSRAWMADGYATWLRILTNQRINLPVENDFGVSGNTFAMMLARVRQVIAANPDYCIIEGGSNDIPTLVTDDDYRQMRNVWRTLVTTIRNAGITPIIMPVPPRAGAVLTASQVKMQQRFYNDQREFSLKTKGVLFIDFIGYWLDQTSSTSVPLAGFVKTDNLHPTNIGAYYMGKPGADLINQLLPPRPTQVLSNADIYDATINPTGNLLYSGANNRGLLSGTGGTETANANLTYTGGGTGGGLAAGATFVRGSATSVCTVTNTKENPRTDTGRASGERQVVQIAASSGGGADEVYNLRLTPALADVQAGDWYYGEAAIEISGAPVNVSALEFYLLETRPSNSQTAIDLAMNSSLAGVLPNVTWSGVLRTPPIQRTADATALQANIRARLKTDVGAASITFKVGDMVVRKADLAFN